VTDEATPKGETTPVVVGRMPGPSPQAPVAGSFDGEDPNTGVPTPPSGVQRVVQRRHRYRRRVIEWIAIVAVAVLVAFLVRTFVFQTFYIPSGSMEPTLQVGDRIIVDKLSYDFGSIHTGDIVVFRRPPKEDCPGPPVADLVKRVIGLPGQTISDHDGQVYINSKLLPEPWLPRGTTTTGIRTQKIPPNQYFVMGDNRGDSCDSRMWGTVPRSYIVGKVVMRIWPLSRIHFF